MKPTMYVLTNPFHGVFPTDGSQRTPAFDSYELSLIGHFADDTDGECRRIDSEQDLSDPELRKTTWSIYGHIPDRGVDHLIDASSLDHAIDILRGIGVVSQQDVDKIRAEQA